MQKPVCLITGAGDGTGAAIARRFTAGNYRVALLARTEARLRKLEKELAGSRGYVCDVADLDQLKSTIAKVALDLGPPRVAIHNAVMGEFKPLLAADASTFEKMFRVNTTALMVLAQSVVPAMISAGEGALIVTGNTAGWRGKPAASMFAPTKAAQRILAESMARDFGPKGVHVAYVTIDAAIDTPWTRDSIFPDKPDDFFCKPAAIAEEVYHVAHQDRSAWSFAVEVRPYHETW
jgi:short-subunit dehydrogenase